MRVTSGSRNNNYDQRSVVSDDREAVVGNLIRDKEYAQRAYSQER